MRGLLRAGECPARSELLRTIGETSKKPSVSKGISARARVRAPMAFVQVQELLMVALEATPRGSARSVCGLYLRCINRILG
jgi:hypothetical protein